MAQPDTIQTLSASAEMRESGFLPAGITYARIALKAIILPKASLKKS